MNEEFIAKLDLLFARFYISANGKKLLKSLFAHKDMAEGDRAELLYAPSRGDAQKELEEFFEKSVSDGVWDEWFATHHFYRSVNQPRLVVCRDWQIFKNRYANKVC